MERIFRSSRRATLIHVDPYDYDVHVKDRWLQTFWVYLSNVSSNSKFSKGAFDYTNDDSGKLDYVIDR